MFIILQMFHLASHTNRDGVWHVGD